eukprot:7942503-Pyramimonas_sp.AAC.1
MAALDAVTAAAEAKEAELTKEAELVPAARAEADAMQVRVTQSSRGDTAKGPAGVTQSSRLVPSPTVKDCR